MIINENVDKKVIAIAGGKGGVGKSMFAATLAMMLALNNKKTVLVDLDLGGSNMHTLLGMKNNNPGIGNFLNDQHLAISDLVVATPFNNLFMVPGDVQVYGLGDLALSQKKEIMNGILEIEADFIILDLGAGCSFNVVDFFLISNAGLVVTTPHKTSITNSYSFLKNVAFRFLQRAFSDNEEVTSYFLGVLKEQRPGSIKTIPEMIDDIRKFDSDAAEKAEVFLSVLQPKMIVNMVEEPEDIDISEGLAKLAKRNLDLNLECLGALYYDKQIADALKSESSFLLEGTNSVVLAEVERISQKIIQSKYYPEMPLALDLYKDTFELTQIEIANDFEIIKKSTPTSTSNAPTSNSGDYNVEELLDLLNRQQAKIEEMQKLLHYYGAPTGNLR